MFNKQSINSLARNTSTLLAVSTLALFSAATVSFAGSTASRTCASLDSSAGGSPAIATDVNISVQPGDTVRGTLTGILGNNLAVAPSTFDFFPVVGPATSGVISFSHTTPVAGTVRFSARSGAVRVSCTLAAVAGAASIGDTAGNITGNSQTNAINTSVDRNTTNRLKGGSNIAVSQNTFFFQTPSTEFNLDWNAWVSGEYRSYDGGINGHSADFVIGIDRKFNESFLAGVLIGYSDVDITEGASFADGKSLAIGPYFGAKLSENLLLDGFVTTARPDYTTNNGSFKSKRTSYGLSLRGFVESGSTLITPALELRGFSEDQPAYGAVAANKITSSNARASVRFDFPQAFGGAETVPYFSLGADHGRASSTATGKSDFTAGRFGLGLSDTSGPGTLTLDMDYGKVRSDVRDFGIRMRYLVSF